MADIGNSLPIFLRIKQAAHVLSITPETLRRMISEDSDRPPKERLGPPIHKIGRQIRIHKADFERWLDSRKRTI